MLSQSAAQRSSHETSYLAVLNLCATLKAVALPPAEQTGFSEKRSNVCRPLVASCVLPLASPPTDRFGTAVIWFEVASRNFKAVRSAKESGIDRRRLLSKNSMARELDAPLRAPAGQIVKALPPRTSPLRPVFFAKIPSGRLRSWQSRHAKSWRTLLLSNSVAGRPAEKSFFDDLNDLSRLRPAKVPAGSAVREFLSQ